MHYAIIQSSSLHRQEIIPRLQEELLFIHSKPQDTISGSIIQSHKYVIDLLVQQINGIAAEQVCDVVILKLNILIDK